MTMQLMMEVAPMQRVPPCEQSKEAIRQLFVSGVEEAHLESESIRLAAASGLSSGHSSRPCGIGLISLEVLSEALSDFTSRQTFESQPVF